MIIKAEKWNFDGTSSYKILHIEKCCDKIINSENISLNTELDEHDNYVNDEKDYSVKLVRVEYGYDDYKDYYYEKIDFCPFCGKSIEINIIKEIDKTEEYNLLKNERDTLWKKYYNTDSKKKSQELEKQVRELDKKINEILTDDNFKKSS